MSPEEIVDLSCYIVTDEVRVYDLRPLQKTDGSAYEQDDLKMNFCAYLPETKTFATLSGTKNLTGWKVTAD